MSVSVLNYLQCPFHHSMMSYTVRAADGYYVSTISCGGRPSTMCPDRPYDMDGRKWIAVLCCPRQYEVLSECYEREYREIKVHHALDRPI